MRSPPRVLVAAVLLALVACKPQAVAPPTPGTPAPSRSVAPPALVRATPRPLPSLDVDAAVLRGTVSAPSRVVSNNGGLVLSNHGANIISDQGSGLVSDNGHVLISDQGQGIVSNNGGSFLGRVRAGGGFLGRVRYAVRQAPPAETALTNAYLYLTNRDEQFYVNTETNLVFNAASDSEGRYAFPITATNGFPVGREVIVTARLTGDQRFTGYLVPARGQNALKIGIASTLCTELLRAEATRTGQALAAYDAARFETVVSLTERAIAEGALPTALELESPAGKVIEGVFDFRVSRANVLRDQYVMLMAAVSASAEPALKNLSDAWLALTGRRLRAITLAAGTGETPGVADNGERRLHDGDPGTARPATSHLAAAIGNCWGVAAAKNGDVFITSSSPFGHVRWLKRDGTVSTIAAGGLTLVKPVGVAIEREPGEGGPGSLLVVDEAGNHVVRLAITDAPGGPVAELVAGDTGALPGLPAIDGTRAATSRWRISDEGARVDAAGQPIAKPARLAALAQPTDVCVDDLGNIYVSDTSNHRVRMIAGEKAEGQKLYGYREPIDADGDGIIDRFGADVALRAGAIYTIAGNPPWIPALVAQSGTGWRGEYMDAASGLGQEARFHYPSAVAFHDGALYISDTHSHRVRRLARADGRLTTFAGKPQGRQNVDGTTQWFPAGGGDAGPAAEATFRQPVGLAFDARGRLLVRDHATIRRIGLDGRIETLAGHYVTPNGVDVEPLEGEAAYSAHTHFPWDFGAALAVDPEGHVLVPDSNWQVLRKLWLPWD